MVMHYLVFVLAALVGVVSGIYANVILVAFIMYVVIAETEGIKAIAPHDEHSPIDQGKPILIFVIHFLLFGWFSAYWFWCHPL
jgi:hypothetical protein